MGATNIKATFFNPNATAGTSIYVNESNNDLTLTFENDTGSAINMASVNWSCSFQGESFGIVVSFASLYAAQGGQQPVQVSADGFNAGYCPGNSESFLLTPSETASWADDGSIVLKISNLAPTVAVGTYYIAVTVTGLAWSRMFAFFVPVQVQNAPNVAVKALPVSFDFTPANADSNNNTLLTTKNANEPISNSLTLVLANRSGSPLVDPATPPSSTPSQFILSFVAATDPGYHALNTVDLLQNVSVGLASGTTGWTVTPLLTSPRTWSLQPTADNVAILEPGTAGIAEFSITSLVTQSVAGPTIVYLQYLNVAGYNDGVLTQIMQKKYATMVLTHPTSINLSNPIDVSAASTAVMVAYLTWSLQNSSLVELESMPPAPPQPGGTTSPSLATANFGAVNSSQQAFPIGIQENENFVLTGYDMVLNQILSCMTPVVVTPSLESRWLPRGAIVAWSGTEASRPPGFEVCNGLNGTPNLMNRFILGAGGSYAVGNTGDGSHTHSMNYTTSGCGTSSVGDHTHGLPGAWYARNFGTPGIIGKGYTALDTASTGVSSKFQNAGAHSHTIPASSSFNTLTAVSGGTKPPWYALYYIMKTN
jgi:hypothetical protein